MPTVPMHEGRRVSRTGIPDARRSAASTAIAEGAGLERAREETGQAIAQLGSTVARIGTGLYAEIRAKERKRADEVALLEANNQLDAFELGLNSPNGGAFNTRGKDAFELPEKVEKDFNELADKISQGLGTPEQKLAFEKMRSNRGMGIQLNISRHVAGEMRSYEQGQLEGTLTNAISLAGANSSDPRRVATEIEKGETAIRAVATNRGQSAEQTEQQLLTFRSGAHLSVISNQLAQGKTAGAKAYFEEVKDQIAGDKWDEVEKQLRAGTQKEAAQTAADEIVAAGGTLSEQRAKAKQLEDPDVRDQALAYIEHEHAVVEREENEAHKEVLKTGVYDVIDRGAGIRGIDSRVWANLSGEERRSAQIYAEAKARGIPVQTDQATFYSYMTMARNNPEKFVNENLLSARHRLSDGDLQQLASLQLSISRSDASAADKVLAGFSTKQEIVENTLTSYGIDPKAKADTPQGKAVAQLYRMLDRRVDALQQDGKKASNPEIQQALDELLSQSTTVEGSWWNIFPGGKPFFDQRKRLVDTTIDDVPKATKTAIEDARRRRGLPVSDATTLDTYLEMQVK